MRRSTGPKSGESLRSSSSAPPAPKRKRRRKRRQVQRTPSRVLWNPTGIGFIVLMALFSILLLSMAFLLVSLISSKKTNSGLRIPRSDTIVHNDIPATFQRYSDNAPPCDSILPDDVSYTLVTQLSNDRLWMMEYHCHRWNSLMSVAVFTNQTLDETRQKLVQLGCNLDEMTVQVVSSTLYPSDDYPVNVLRNKALSVVTTTHVVYVDVDFWESQDLEQLLEMPQVREALAEDYKRALVLPAFQLNRQCREWRECPENNVPLMPMTRQDLLKLLKQKKADPFDPTNRGGHGSTLYSKWVKSNVEQDLLMDIPCVYSNRYEPYLVFRYCHDLPPFQEAFSGYGKNKMTMVMHMIQSGYRLTQLNVAFIVHYPHLDSKSRMEWNTSPEILQPHKSKNGKWWKKSPNDVHLGQNWTNFKRGRVDATFLQFRKWLQAEIPNESVIPKCDNAEDDDSKLWYDRTTTTYNN